MGGKLAEQMTTEEKKRKRWLNRTAGQAARRLQAAHLAEYKKLMAQVRREHPYEDFT